nr:hypothetical protein CFP56_63939 [Quercus suber]
MLLVSGKTKRAAGGSKRGGRGTDGKVAVWHHINVVQPSNITILVSVGHPRGDGSSEYSILLASALFWYPSGSTIQTNKLNEGFSQAFSLASARCFQQVATDRGCRAIKVSVLQLYRMVIRVLPFSTGSNLLRQNFERQTSSSSPVTVPRSGDDEWPWLLRAG